MNWRTNLGGAITCLGTSLMGIGVLGNHSTHAEQLWYIAATGFILSALGSSLTALFAADSRKLERLEKRVENDEKD